MPTTKASSTSRHPAGTPHRAIAARSLIGITAGFFALMLFLRQALAISLKIAVQTALALTLLACLASQKVVVLLFEVVVSHEKNIFLNQSITSQSRILQIAAIIPGSFLLHLTGKTRKCGAHCCFEAAKESENRVRFNIERPSVSSSVYSISLPTLTPLASMVIFTSG